VDGIDFSPAAHARRHAMRTACLAVIALAVGSAEVALAQTDPRMPRGLRDGLLARFDDATGKVLQLAEAMPAETYTWRPRPGVRSVSEVLIHIAQGNYYTAEDAGVKRPSGFRPDAESAVTAKPQVIAYVKQAGDHLRRALAALTESDLRKPATAFGQETSYGNVYLFGVSHVHEHLGQLVAYARQSGVVPPWSKP
jgi:uncharacterized damage-inducible protein DinB